MLIDHIWIFNWATCWLLMDSLFQSACAVRGGSSTATLSTTWWVPLPDTFLSWWWSLFVQVAHKHNAACLLKKLVSQVGIFFICIVTTFFYTAKTLAHPSCLIFLKSYIQLDWGATYVGGPHGLYDSTNTHLSVCVPVHICSYTVGDVLAEPLFASACISFSLVKLQ